MVIKTETCQYTEYKIYPGRGIRIVAKDGKATLVINHKAGCLFKNKTRAAKLGWTQARRRVNKKMRTDESSKRKTRRTVKAQRAIVGMSLEELRQKKAAKPTTKTTAAAEKDHKDKARKQQAEKKVVAPAKGKQQTAAPKNLNTQKAAPVKTGKRF